VNILLSSETAHERTRDYVEVRDAIGGPESKSGEARTTERKLMGRWIVLQHVDWEGPGAIATEARERGIRLEIRRMDMGNSVPDADDIDGLIVMGGPMGVYEADKYRFLNDELLLIANMVYSRKPVLGVCLGAQLLAAALGARVYKGPAEEIGFGDVNLEKEALGDPVFSVLANPLPVLHWHGDTFDLPQAAVLLAGNGNYAHQAFRYGGSAYGLQFHPELDARIWEAWKRYLPAHATAVADRRRAQVEACGRRLFARFFDVVLPQML
jgi:GMP synthase (glutamine-hydrolysing)